MQEDATAAAVSAAAAAASAAATAESEATPTASTVIAALSKQRNAAENQSTSTTTTSPHPTTTATTAPSTARATTAIVGDFTSIRQQSLFSLLNSYSDILHTSRAYPASLDPADEELDAVLLHCLNHITKSAELIKKNNEALAKGGGKDAGGGLPRDQVGRSDLCLELSLVILAHSLLCWPTLSVWVGQRDVGRGGDMCLSADLEGGRMDGNICACTGRGGSPGPETWNDLKEAA